jgi:hypothetical protein
MRTRRALAATRGRAGSALAAAAAAVAAGCGSAQPQHTALGSRIGSAQLEHAFRLAGLRLEVVPPLLGAPPAFWVHVRAAAPAAGSLVLFPTSASAFGSSHPRGAVLVENVELAFYGNATAPQRRQILAALETAAEPSPK